MAPKRSAKREISNLSPEESPSRARKVARKSADSSGSLTGIKIVVSGVPESFTRDHFEAHLKAAGGVITGSVSGVTNLLIIGKVLEDGRPPTEGSKYKKACELLASGKSKGNLKILTEEQLFALYPSIAPNNFTDAPLNLELPKKSHDLWSEKWRPRTIQDFVFNVEAFRSFEQWLKSWSNSQENERGALLSGPPGVGKTSCAYAVADQLGYNLSEFNASDTRGQKQLRQLHDLISGGVSLSKGEITGKLLILMDEADGLSSGDRGGAQELGKMLKVSRVPIVCTCNDKQHPKVRSLAKSCRVIEFRKCEKTAAVRRAHLIAKKEGYTVSDSYISEIWEASDGDMRQMLNGIQSNLFARPTEHGSLQKYVLKDRNQSEDAFQAVRRMFGNTSMSARERLDAFFVDYDLVPLIVYENYLKVCKQEKTDKPNTALLKARHAIDSMAYADIINGRIRANAQWDLLPDYGFFSSVCPTMMIQGAIFRVDFPKFLGRISSTNKHKRQLAEISAKTGKAGRRLLSDGYYEALGDELVAVLRNDSLDVVERVEEFIENVSAYGMSRELVVENLMETRITKNTPTPYEQVDTKVKATLTRAWKERQAREIIRSHEKGSGKRSALAKRSRNKKTGSSVSTPVALLDDTEEEETTNPEVMGDQEEEERRMAGIF